MEYYLEFEGNEDSARVALCSLNSTGISIDFVAGQDNSVSEWVVVANGENLPSTLQELAFTYSNAQIKYYPKYSYDSSFVNQCEVSFYRIDRPDNNMVSQASCNAQVLHKETNLKITSERFRSQCKNEQEALSLLKSKLVAINA